MKLVKEQLSLWSQRSQVLRESLLKRGYHVHPWGASRYLKPRGATACGSVDGGATFLRQAAASSHHLHLQGGEDTSNLARHKHAACVRTNQSCYDQSSEKLARPLWKKGARPGDQNSSTQTRNDRESCTKHTCSFHDTACWLEAPIYQ